MTFADIREAAERIRPHVIQTPVITIPQIDPAVGAELFFKCENLQHVGAFKARGACNAVFCLSEKEAAAGVVTHSSGNHAAALARAARLRGIRAHIVMPRNSAAVKIAAVRSLGTEPVFCEPDTASRQAAADQLLADTGATFIHPYDNVHVMAGQGTAAMELLQQVEHLDILVVPVGGGGLLSGTLVAVRAMKPELKVIAAEPEWADDAYRSLQVGTLQPPTRYDTIADGLRTGLGRLTFPIIRDLVEQILTVSENRIREATLTLVQQGRVVVEPSGAVPLAAVLQHRAIFAGQRVGIILSGGNLDLSLLTSLTNTAKD
ncbi:MAG: pyridoxal-phosphate dependent enzyme [Fuerstiella sp.]